MSYYDLNGDGQVDAWERDAVAFRDGEYPGQPCELGDDGSYQPSRSAGSRKPMGCWHIALLLFLAPVAFFFIYTMLKPVISMFTGA